MFILRCAFWLSLVYASMSWNDHRFPGLGTQALAVSHEAGAALAKSAVSVCADRAAECFDDAAKLTALVDSVLEPAARHGTRVDGVAGKPGRGAARPS